MRGRAFVYRWWCRRRRVTIDSHSSSPACVYLGVVVCLRTHARTQFVWYVCTELWVFSFFPFQKSACGDQIMLCVCVCVFCTGGMPAPEQSPVTEEGLLLTIRDSSTGRNMEADNTANNILASVKEQVLRLFGLFRSKSPLIHVTHLILWHC